MSRLAKVARRARQAERPAAATKRPTRRTRRQGWAAEAVVEAPPDSKGPVTPAQLRAAIKKRTGEDVITPTIFWVLKEGRLATTKQIVRVGPGLYVWSQANNSVNTAA